MASSKPPPLYRPRYPLDMRPGGPRSRSGRCREEKNVLLPGIEPRPSLLAIQTKLFIRHETSKYCNLQANVEPWVVCVIKPFLLHPETPPPSTNVITICNHFSLSLSLSRDDELRERLSHCSHSLAYDRTAGFSATERAQRALVRTRHYLRCTA
jgi:hypothetical protein